jgi:hypothetical protein
MSPSLFHSRQRAAIVAGVLALFLPYEIKTGTKQHSFS